jgi:hypothetical protein
MSRLNVAAACRFGQRHRGSFELHAGRFVAIDLSSEVVGKNFATLYDARQALTQTRR